MKISYNERGILMPHTKVDITQKHLINISTTRLDFDFLNSKLTKK